MSSYVLSIKLLRQQIHSSGANLVIASEYVKSGEVHRTGHSPIPANPSKYDRLLFHEAPTTATIGQQNYQLVEYMPDSTHLFPRRLRNTIYLLPVQPTQKSMPEKLKLEGYNLQAVTIPETEAGLLRRLYQSGAVFIPYGSLNTLWQNGYMRRYVLRMKDVTASAIQRQEQTLHQLAKLDKRNLHIMSSGKLLEELGETERTQYSFRVWVTIGISAIICLLLTSISSLEFRQNRYVYALIGSFGISRLLLFLSFIIENTVLVTMGFVGSLAALWSVREYITSVLYKSPNLTLNLWELENDIRTFCLAFGICVLVSSLPIGIAASRSIGKVLK